MNFSNTLARLREVLKCRQRGVSEATRVVQTEDLRELLRHFDRLDDLTRAYCMEPTQAEDRRGGLEALVIEKDWPEFNVVLRLLQNRIECGYVISTEPPFTITVNTEKLLGDFNAAADLDSWENPHPVFLMALEIDDLKRRIMAQSKETDNIVGGYSATLKELEETKLKVTKTNTAIQNLVTAFRKEYPNGTAILLAESLGLLPPEIVAAPSFDELQQKEAVKNFTTQPEFNGEYLDATNNSQYRKT